FELATVLDVFVNYRRPRFELRSAWPPVWCSGAAHVDLSFGRQDSEHLNGFQPGTTLRAVWRRSSSAVWLRENGSSGLARLITGWTNGKTPAAAGGSNVGSITDIHVVLSNGTTGGSSPRRRAKHTCLLASFTVTSRYFKHIDDGRSIALFKEADVYRPANGGWPDRQFTEKARSFRDYYRLLLRSNRIQLNQPHLSLPVPGHLADLARNRAGNEDA
uniref:PX domain-containing protein n=1 Tax=Macrostomum lignano TaxID=282301 RepID=A0A1I8JMN6_9PLAT